MSIPQPHFHLHFQFHAAPDEFIEFGHAINFWILFLQSTPSPPHMKCLDLDRITQRMSTSPFAVHCLILLCLAAGASSHDVFVPCSIDVGVGRAIGINKSILFRHLPFCNAPQPKLTDFFLRSWVSDFGHDDTMEVRLQTADKWAAGDIKWPNPLWHDARLKG